MPKKKTTPSKVKEEPIAKPEKRATPLKQATDEIDEIFASKKRNKLEPEQSQEQATLLKQAADEIDEIFASKKRKKLEAEESKKAEEKVNGKPKKEKPKKKRTKEKSEGSHRRTNDGFKIYQVDELGINKPGSGFTPLCPFDCSCCF